VRCEVVGDRQGAQMRARGEHGADPPSGGAGGNLRLVGEGQRLRHGGHPGGCTVTCGDLRLQEIDLAG
jgi:hypothetical protein